MRLWSIHPIYLDSKGLVALWREGLLAQKVLLGETKGYKNHPQLNRWKDLYSIAFFPAEVNYSLSQYLLVIYEEAKERGYNFNKEKIWKPEQAIQYLRLTVTKGQLLYEFTHLMQKLNVRCKEQYWKNLKLTKAQMLHNDIKIDNLKPHPLFKVIEGEVELWEKTNK